MILTEVHGVPPSIKFSFQTFKDFTISFFKGFTKIKYNDLVNSFTHRVQQYSHVKDIIERLRFHNHNTNEKFKNTADNLEDIIKSENITD